MADKRAVVDIAVPDDFPSVFQGTVAHERAKSLGDVRVHAARGADDEAELIKRIDRARIAINIRAHARFTEGVFTSFSHRAEPERARALGARPASKEEILAEADVVTLHLRLIPVTRGFLGRRELGAMKRSALLVNTARGALVERDALLEALSAGKIAG